MITEENDTDPTDFYETPLIVEILFICDLCGIEVSTLGTISELDRVTHEATFSWPAFFLIPVEKEGFTTTF